MIKISVNEDELSQGLPGDCLACPIALALINQGYNKVWVDDNFVAFNDEVYSLPKNARYFIQDFDNLEDVRPLNFELTDRILPLPDQQSSE